MRDQPFECGEQNRGSCESDRIRSPYFYVVPANDYELESVREGLWKRSQKSGEIAEIAEASKKILGKERRVLKAVTYRGAIVLEPKTGLHHKVAVLDFTSMYPTLMENYNLSPDTFLRPDEKVDGESVYVVPDVGYRFRKEPDGSYRKVIRTLLTQRKKVKKELESLEENSTRFKVLKERERALKILTNACYGYAGWAGARWYVREMAESAVALGRDTITKTMAEADLIGLHLWRH